MKGLEFVTGPDSSINWSDKDIDLAIKNEEYNKKINDDTMLMHAVKTNDIELAKKLLKLGADPSIGDKRNRTPLWLCTIYNTPKIARLLIENGASMEEVEGTNSPLYNAIKHDNNEVAKELIQLGADVNILNRDNQTPLHCATFRNNAEMVEILLKNGADKNIKNEIQILPGELVFGERNSQTALDIAKEKGYKEIINLLEDDYKQKEKPEKEKNNNTKRKKIDDDLREKDWDSFYDYLLDRKILDEKQEEYDNFIGDYEDFEEEFLNEEFATDYNIIKNFEYINPLIQTVTLEDYKDKIKLYNDLVEKKEEIKETINKKEEPLSKIRREMFSLENKNEELKRIKSKKSSENKEKKKLCLETYYGIFAVELIGVLLGSAGGIMILFGAIAGFVLIGLLITFFQFTIEALKKYSAIVFVYLIGGLILKVTLIGVPLPKDIGILICISHFIIEVPLLILLCFYIKQKSEYSNSDEIIENDIKHKELVEKYQKEVTKYEKSIKEEEQALSEIEKQIEKLGSKKINKEKYIIQVEDMKAFFELNLVQEKKKIAKRWNEFSTFRKNHYVREIEEKIQQDDIYNRLLDLVGDKELLDSTKYNSKNYKNEGIFSDYVEYIFDKIDDENDSL